MSKFTGKFESAKQEWETPFSLWNPLNERFRFNVDLAADISNHKCMLWLGPGSQIAEDSLSISWDGMGVGWLNCPYGSTKAKMSDWVKKSWTESRGDQDPPQVVMLIPARTNTNWWANYCMKSDLVIFLTGRPKFGGADHGLPQPLAVVVFTLGKTETRFETLKI